MKLRYTLKSDIPCLAWCLEIEKGSDSADVIHGAQLETHEHGFLEGAWDGCYQHGGFDRAKTLVGSGVAVRGDDLVVCAATDYFDKLFLLRDDKKLWASNSLAFLLLRSGRELDIRYPWYLFDLLRAKRWGLRKKYKFMHLAGNEKILLLDYSNLIINRQLEWEREEKPLYPEPRSFSEYQELLQGVINRVTQNASDPERRTSYSTITAISHGYDSTATSVMAARAGCKQAYTFVTPQPDGGTQTDDGTEVAQMLGLEVQSFPRYQCHELPGIPEAEFHAGCPDATGPVVASAELLLGQRLCFQGHAGEDAWEIDVRYALPENLNPDSDVIWSLGEKEFRLRVGYLLFTVPNIAYQHREAFEAISTSEEMKPWSLPDSSYNRPIPRRIIEQAGIPRGHFATYKTGGAYTRHPWKEESTQDFETFLANNDVPRWFLRGRRHWMDWLMLPFDGLYMVHKKYLNSIGFKHTLPVFMHATRRSLDYRRRHKSLYSMHWGIEKIRHRYDG